MIKNYFSISFLSLANKDLLKLIASGVLGFSVCKFFFFSFLTLNTLLALAIKRIFVQITYHNAWRPAAILRWPLYSPCHLFGRNQVM